MSKIAIVTDTISCIPAEILTQYGIRVVPVGLVIDRKVYKDTELSNEDFWKLFYQTKENITTVAGNPADFENIFSELCPKVEGIVCIPVSKLLSGTYNMALQAKQTVLQKFPNVQIEVIDSKSATGAQGYIAIEAARAANQGKSFNEVVNIARDMVPKVKFLTAMTTLKYLRKSGRAPKSAFIGDWLKVKPIIGMVNGSGLVENLGRERGMDAAIGKMVEMTSQYIDSSRPLHLMVHFTDDIKSGQQIKDIMTSKYQCAEVYMTPYTPVMASQTGPVIAVAFYQ